MYDYQNASKRIHAQRHKPALCFGVRIFNCDSQWIAECLFGMGEANPVFG